MHLHRWGSKNYLAVMPPMYHRDTKQLQQLYKRQLWREVGVWMQDRAQTLWDGGLPDEAAALYSEFAVDT